MGDRRRCRHRWGSDLMSDRRAGPCRGSAGDIQNGRDRYERSKPANLVRGTAWASHAMLRRSVELSVWPPYEGAVPDVAFDGVDGS